MISFVKASIGNNAEKLYGSKLNVTYIFYDVLLIPRYNKKLYVLRE